MVERGLVDSTFGNVSCRVSPPAGDEARGPVDGDPAVDVWSADAVYDATPEPAAGAGDLLLVSQTGSALDELAGVIDACRFDDATTVGITASSELVAHRAIYDGGPARTILHGHPPFCVILSMDCPRLDCPGLGQCHRACSEQRGLTTDLGVFVPIVPGEVGTGRYGLCHTLPPPSSMATDCSPPARATSATPSPRSPVWSAFVCGNTSAGWTNWRGDWLRSHRRLFPRPESVGLVLRKRNGEMRTG